MGVKPSLNGPNADTNPPTEPPNCPTNYVLVPANADLSTAQFCVAKYEMKAALNNGTPVLDGNNGDVPLDVNLHIAESRRTGTPWIRITQEDILAECEEIGAGYKLITLSQWNALARDIESNDDNWSESGTMGRILAQGHSDSTIDANSVADGYSFGLGKMLAASTDDNPYAGTGNSTSDGPEQIRTHILTNSEVVWDLAGNAREFVDIDGLGGTVSYTNPYVSNYYEFLSEGFANTAQSIVSSNGFVVTEAMLKPLNPIANSTNGGGRVYLQSGFRDLKVIARGGNFTTDNTKGIFGADFDSVANGLSSSGGFRCAYNFN